MLIDAKILSPGSKLVCANQNVRGVLNSDGSITVKIDGTERVFEYLSGAARFIEKISINGWIYWSIEIDGKKHDLSSFRDQYVEGKKNS